MDKRKAFNFYRSYYEVALELPQAAQREYLMALLHFQFTGEEPKLKGMAKFALMSQKHSIIRQLEGYSHGKKGGAPPKGTDNPPPKGSENHTPEGNENQGQGEVQEQEQGKEKDKDKELYSEHFNKFWNLYDKKIDRAKCEAKFNRLKKDEVESILKTLPNYVKANPEIKYRKNPLTYLNGKCWMDEIIITGSNNPVEKSQSPPNQYTPFETNGFLFDDYEIPMKDFLYQLPKVLKEDCLSGKYPKK